MIQHLNPQPSKPQRVVILGNRGFVGKRLTDRLVAQGIQVHGISSSEVDLCLSNSVDPLRDLLRPGDAVVFTSAITPDKGKDVRALIKNLQMAQHVAAALESVQVSHIIYLSSDAVFRDDLPPITENTPAAPPTVYGLMHLTREKILEEILGKSKTPYLILRPCAIYGPGDTHSSYGPNRFLRSALKEKKIKLFGQGEEKRPHLYIDDLISVLSESLLRKTSGLLHIVHGESLSFGAIAQQIIRLTNNGTTIESLPRSGPVTHKHFDCSDYLRSFPQLPFTSLEDGLKEFLISPA
jgi:nucleoside-diphosphate-sugar epimerase